MAKVDGLFLRGSKFYLRIIIPQDLRGIYCKDRVTSSLGTSDRLQAILKATQARAKWLTEFDDKRRIRDAQPVVNRPGFRGGPLG